MKNNTLIAAAAAVALFLAVPLYAEKLTMDDDERPAPAAASPTLIPSVKVKPTATTVKAAEKPVEKPTSTAVSAPSVEDLKPRLEALKSELEKAKAQNDALQATVKDLQDTVKKLETAAQEAKASSTELETLRSKMSGLEERTSKDRDTLDKYADDFDNMKDTIKSNVDKLQGWNDIIDVLKKQINDNELELAKIKKTINDVKGRYGTDDDGLLNQILKWPYAGLTALVLSIIALSVAVAK